MAESWTTFRTRAVTVGFELGDGGDDSVRSQWLPVESGWVRTLFCGPADTLAPFSGQKLASGQKVFRRINSFELIQGRDVEELG